MARPFRLSGENCLYHITSRGNDHKRIYVIPGNYERFLDYVKQAKERYRFYLYAYCLMPNHFHLLLETRLPNISKIMQYINSSYTTYYNIRHHRCGHLFQGRFKSLVVDRDNYFLEVSRYIHLNPVRAGIVKDPMAYNWSSFNEYLGNKHKYIDNDQVRQYIRMDRHQYRNFVLDGVNKAPDLMSKVYAGFLLGTDSFIKNQLKNLEAQTSSAEVSHKKELKDDKMRAMEIVQTVADYYRTTLDKLKASKTRPMRVKQIMIYLLRSFTGLTNREIGDLMGMRYSAVSKTGLNIEHLMEVDKKVRRAINGLVSSFEV
jgi:REP element-mobilizing transposase RayT